MGSPLRSGLVALTLTLVGLAPLPAAAQAPSPATPRSLPRFEKAACPFPSTKESGRVTCGYLYVPESRSRPTGRVLRLAVAIAHSRSAHPAADPLVYLQGGPGAGAVEGVRYVHRVPFWTRFRAGRDLVFYDQRGTGLSDPAFCPELSVTLSRAPLRGLSVREAEALERDALHACRERMIREGLDFSAYSSATNARDLDDLRRALGYRAWNLLGTSYGVRLALTAMRDTPGGIRSVILDSSMPLSARHEVDAPAKYARALGLVFTQCAADAACHHAFPTLEPDFYAALEDYERRPLVLAMPDTTRFPQGRVVIDGALLAQGIYQSLYSRNAIPVVPLTIEAAKARNAPVLSALADGLVGPPTTFNAGLSNSVLCYEALPFNPQAMIDAERARYPKLRPWYRGPAQEALCAAWHEYRADSTEFQPVRSDLPTLVLSGEFDPVTPPSYGRLVASTLSHATFVEARGVGHGVLGSLRDASCVQEVAAAFLDDPGRIPDTRCASALPAMHFVSAVHRSPGVYRAATTLGRGPGPGLLVGAGLTGLLLASPLVVWPVGALARRRRGRAAGGLARHPGPRWLAALTALLALGFAGGLVMVLMQTGRTNPYVLAFGVPAEDGPLFVIPWIVLALTLGVAVQSVLVWRRRWWGLAARLHYSLVAAACVAFVVWVLSWRLL